MSHLNETTTITAKAAYTGAAMTTTLGQIASYFAGVNWADVASIVGIIIGISTFFINWYYKRKDYELRERELNNKLTHG